MCGFANISEDMFPLLLLLPSLHAQGQQAEYCLKDECGQTPAGKCEHCVIKDDDDGYFCDAGDYDEPMAKKSLMVLIY